MSQILVADDEANLRRVLVAQLEHDGYEVHDVDNGQSALELLRAHHIDVVVTDLKMPAVDGMELLRRLKEEHPRIPVIMITAHGSVDTAVEALKLGAFDYVTKPFDRAEFKNVIRKAVKTSELGQHSLLLDAGVSGRYRIIGTSEPIRQVYEVIEKVADTPTNVLITGESGTGKELIADALHQNSARREMPMVRVNCAAIPPDLIESELFGYEKGAFTGAVTSKPGRFELAHQGTLFLDEIGEIPVNMQVKLLRAIQDQSFERVGGVKTIEVDVRLIAATNRDLKQEIDAGRFREDLYYRINVVHIELPPLRGRPDDIPLLIEHFVTKYNEKLQRRVAGFSDSALELLTRYPWPGNIRELENTIERCMIFAEGEEVQREDLPEEMRISPQANVASNRVDTGSLGRVADNAGLKVAVREATAKLEKDFIERALAKTGGNVTHTARILKISRKSLQMKMKEFGLRDE